MQAYLGQSRHDRPYRLAVFLILLEKLANDEGALSEDQGP